MQASPRSIPSGRGAFRYRKNSGENRRGPDSVAETGGRPVIMEAGSGKPRASPPLLRASAVFANAGRIKFEEGNVLPDGEADHYPLFASGFFSEIARLPFISFHMPRGPCTRYRARGS